MQKSALTVLGYLTWVVVALLIFTGPIAIFVIGLLFVLLAPFWFPALILVTAYATAKDRYKRSH